MINYRRLVDPTVLLASCLVGLIASPYFYIGIGALFNFSLAFSLIMLPPLLLGSGFLLRRFLAKPNGQKKSILLTLTEITSWLVIVAFLVFISGFSLFTLFERTGLFCTFWLLATVLCLPLVSRRETIMEQRVKRLPKGIVVATLALMLLSSGAFAIAYQLSAQKFI